MHKQIAMAAVAASILTTTHIPAYSSDVVVPPLGFTAYCTRVEMKQETAPIWCDKTQGNVHDFPMVPINNEDHSLLVAVNRTANAHLVYTSDPANTDFWQMPSSNNQADCEDYAIYKFQYLKAMGVSEESMYIASGYLKDGAYHAVLLVYTENGFLVLDNMTDKILPTSHSLIEKWVGRSTKNMYLWVPVT